VESEKKGGDDEGEGGGDNNAPTKQMTGRPFLAEWEG